MCKGTGSPDKIYLPAAWEPRPQMDGQHPGLGSLHSPRLGLRTLTRSRQCFRSRLPGSRSPTHNPLHPEMALLTATIRPSTPRSHGGQPSPQR